MSTKSGKPPDEFIYEHFTKKEQVVKSKRWKVECKYCPGSVIVEHRDSCCLNHMINNCKNVPADAKREARVRLMNAISPSIAMFTRHLLRPAGEWRIICNNSPSTLRATHRSLLVLLSRVNSVQYRIEDKTGSLRCDPHET